MMARAGIVVGSISSIGDIVLFCLRKRKLVQQRCDAGVRGLHARCELGILGAQDGALRAQFGVLPAQCMGQRGQLFNFLCQVFEI